MILEICKYGEPVLFETAQPVTDFGGELETLVENMFETMYAAPGVGLAAPQVGVGVRIFVCDVSLGRNPSDLMTFVNPEFVERDGR
jgi:peptide deformylase